MSTDVATISKGTPGSVDLKNSVLELIKDLLTNEVAIIDETDSVPRVLYYASLELGGDGYQVITDSTIELGKLPSELLIASVNNRKAVWTFIETALM